MSLGLTVNVSDALADLTTIEQVVDAQSAQIIARTAQTFAAATRRDTPVGAKPKPAGQRLVTGWQTRPVGPLRVHVANIRPHAHLAAMGWDHVGGQRQVPFVRWIPTAITLRAAMVADMTDLVAGGFPAPLRALEVVP